MNGTSRDVQIFEPFGQAFQLMKVILFQPFDLAKWCGIGFAAFLARLGSGGFNFNWRYDQNSGLRASSEFHDFMAKIREMPHWSVVAGVAFLIFMVLVIIVLFRWLRARGEFIFTDCIVRNRGAIVEPWREFRRLGNSYFLFSLLVVFGLGCLAGLLALPFLLPIVRGATFLHRHNASLISMIGLWSMVVISFFVIWVVIAHFMVTVMYCRRCRASEAFRIVCSLIAAYPGEITIYCLFWIVLGLAAVVFACAATCATCCMVIIPYIGTVILLPMLVWLRAFALLYLRQFGPDFDAWREIPPTIPPPLTPPLPA